MTIFRRGNRALCSAALSVCLAALLPGCDWLSGSENVQRTSPFISNLVVSPSFVLCGEKNLFTVAFRFDDPQGDIVEARLLLTHKDDKTAKVTEREEKILWPESLSRSFGTLAIPLSFSCPGGGEPGDPPGDWLIQVTVLDLRDHESNLLEGKITLL